MWRQDGRNLLSLSNPIKEQNLLHYLDARCKNGMRFPNRPNTNTNWHNHIAKQAPQMDESGQQLLWRVVGPVPGIQISTAQLPPKSSICPG